jgi:hypothetical protein
MHIPFIAALMIHHPFSEVMVKGELKGTSASVIFDELEITATLTGNLTA